MPEIFYIIVVLCEVFVLGIAIGFFISAVFDA